MKIQSCLVAFSLFLIAFSAFAKNVEIQTIKPFQKWSADQIQETQILIRLPKNFHAYKDQIKVLNIKPSGFISAQIRVNPEVEFYDKFSKKNRLGLNDAGGTISIY